ncbi:MAG TPA: DUF3618 domain-containing protein [Thermohalobaculum sp.]|nr:DUF3618 domain-containing protein [Thermohalobaculum sp.]
MTSTTTDPGSKSPSEIQRELEDERGRLRETGRALQGKLSVGTIVDELLARTRDRGPDYAVGIGRAIRENPIPVALIGISLAWLMAGGQRLSEERSRYGSGLDLDEEPDFPPPARPFDAAPSEPGPAPLEDDPAVGPADPLRPSPLAGDTGAGSSGLRPSPLADEEDEPLRLGDRPGLGGKPAGHTPDPLKDEDDDEPLTLGEDTRSGGTGSTPPPASRSLEGGEHKRPWETDDKDKI